MSCTLRTFEMPASLSASRNARSGLGVRAQEADRLFAARARSVRWYARNRLNDCIYSITRLTVDRLCTYARGSGRRGRDGRTDGRTDGNWSADQLSRHFRVD